MLSKLPKEFVSDLKKCVDVAKRQRHIQLYSHYDADGITSAAIISIALDRAGISNQLWTFPTLSDWEMEKVSSYWWRCMIMTDLGTSYLRQISSLRKDCVVLDHHRLPADYSVDMHPNVAFSNCEKYGFSGTKDACAATMAYLFAITLDPRNEDLVQIAVAGMIGDNQLTGGATGLNAMVIEDAVERGYLIPYDSLLPCGDVSEYLTYGTTPYLNGISGNPEKIAAFLKDNGFSQDFKVTTEKDGEQKRFQEVIRNYLIENAPAGCADIETPRFVLKDYSLDAEILSLVLDSCGRSFQKDLCLDITKGDEFIRGMQIMMLFRNPLMTLIKDVQLRRLQKMDNFYYFEHCYDAVGGIACSVLSRYVYGPEVPLVALNIGEFGISISSRCQRSLCATGVDMNLAMRKATATVGGSGGGHINAAGGGIPIGGKATFLRTLDFVLGEQKSGSK